MENKEAFIRRSDAHILLANDQLNENKTVTPAEVSASFLFAASRFNAWIAAREFESAEALIDEKEKVIEYFMKEYKQMLDQHLDEHIKTFQFQS